MASPMATPATPRDPLRSSCVKGSRRYPTLCVQNLSNLSSSLGLATLCVRGSIIQQIFSPATKKNNEWQEKLPVVVLKAEEIMYSKANSEGLISAEHRIQLCHLACKSSDFIMVDPWEESQSTYQRTLTILSSLQSPEFSL